MLAAWQPRPYDATTSFERVYKDIGRRLIMLHKQAETTAAMAKETEIHDLQKAARALYESKKYAEALDSFSKAVVLAQKWSGSDVPAILDRRVTVHVKLGNIDLARKDAMSMIRLNKTDGRGYLRCGQLDCLRDDLAAALRWYEHGLKHVSDSNPLRSTLDAQRTKTKDLLDQKLMASNARDPASTLPAEIVQHIASYLDYIDLVRLLRVSKVWKDTFSRLRPLTDSVDFSDAKCEISYKMMVAVLKRLGRNPKRLVMKALSMTAESLLHKNLERWHNYTQLEELNIAPKLHSTYHLPFAKYNLKILDITVTRIAQSASGVPTALDILQGCRSLEIVRFLNLREHLGSALQLRDLRCPTVRILHLIGEQPFIAFEHSTGAIHPEFFTAFPHLEELVCRNLKIGTADQTFDLSAHTNLRKLAISSCGIVQWPKLPPSLEVWDNHDIRTIINLPTESGAFSIGKLDKLRFLRFNKTSLPPWLSSFMPAQPTFSLTSLDIRSTPATSLFGTTTESEITKQFVNLQELALGDNRDLLHGFPLGWLKSLEIVSLMASTIHGAELIELLKRPDNRLRHITLTDCENISPDTIEWARNQGITVHVKKSQAVSGSERRIRGQ